MTARILTIPNLLPGFTNSLGQDTGADRDRDFSGEAGAIFFDPKPNLELPGATLDAIRRLVVTMPEAGDAEHG